MARGKFWMTHKILSKLFRRQRSNIKFKGIQIKILLRKHPLSMKSDNVYLGVLSGVILFRFDMETTYFAITLS